MIVAIIIFLILFILDQVTKLLAFKYAPSVESKTVIPHFLDIQYVENEGMAWSMLNDKTWILVIISFVGSLFLLGALIKFLDWKNAKFLTFSLTLSLAGCFGNFFDRFISLLNIENARGGVIDMIQFKPFDFLCNLLNLGLTTFNLADVFLVIGVISIAIDIIFFKEKREEKLGKIKRKKLD